MLQGFGMLRKRSGHFRSKNWHIADGLNLLLLNLLLLNFRQVLVLFCE